MTPEFSEFRGSPSRVSVILSSSGGSGPLSEEAGPVYGGQLCRLAAICAKVLRSIDLLGIGICQATKPCSLAGQQNTLVGVSVIEHRAIHNLDPALAYECDAATSSQIRKSAAHRFGGNGEIVANVIA